MGVDSRLPGQNSDSPQPSGTITAGEPRPLFLEITMSPLEEKLSRLLAGYGAGIYAEKFRCSSLIRDVYGIQKKEANILIAALKAGVPEALLGQTGEEARHLQDRLVRQLEDSYGLNSSSAQWGVAAWAGMLGKAAPAEAVNSAPIEQTS